jgi:hypothetical protein
MYTKAFLSIILIGFTLSSFSQNNGIVVPGKWSTQIFITDVNGQPFQNKYDKYVGSIFLYDDFRLANITLQNGKAFEKVKTKIDLLNQEMVFLSTDGKLGILNNGQVKEIRFLGEPNDSVSTSVFRTGFPKVDVLNPSSFYEVLADGKLMLLKSLMKYAVENKNELSGEVNRLIEDAENIYTFKDNQMKRLKKDREVLFDLMVDRRSEIASFRNKSTIDLKNINDVKRLLQFYNGLN